MGLDTLDRYLSESERAGWRGVLGNVLSVTGFVVLANAFLIALLFRKLLSFRYQIILAIAGAIVGVLGMILRGSSRERIRTAVIASISAIGATVIVSLLEQRFGWLVMVAMVLAFAWLVQRFEEHAWKKL